MNPAGGRGLHLGTSQFVRCAREHQWSGGRPWVAVWQVPCCAGHVGDLWHWNCRGSIKDSFVGGGILQAALEEAHTLLG